MQKTTRLQRLLAVIVAVFMAVCCLPLSAFADQLVNGTLHVQYMENGSEVGNQDITINNLPYAVGSSTISYTCNWNDLYNKMTDLPTNYELTKDDTGDKYLEFKLAADGVSWNASCSVNVKLSNVTMNIRFMDGDTFVSGGDYPFTAGATVTFGSLTLPDGYELDTAKNSAESGFVAKDGAQVIVRVKKVEAPATNAIVNIRYMDGETVVEGGDYPFTAGATVTFGSLTLPAGYELDTDKNNAESGFVAKDGAQIIVRVKKVEAPATNAIVNIRYMDGETVVEGGDYPFTAGATVTFGSLTLPAGYELDTDKNNAESGFVAKDGAQIIVHVKKSETPAGDVIMNIQFKDGDTVVAGGDYFVPAGVQNYSVLKNYVPEGYMMSVSGDFLAAEGAKLEVPIEKMDNPVIMNIRFMDGDTFVAGGDYFLPAGVQNYKVLEQYLPEGYKLAVSGDFMVKEGTSLDVAVEKESKAIIMNIRFMEGDNFIAGGDYFVREGVNNYKVLDDLGYLPKGYEMDVAGDFMAKEGAKLEVPVHKKKAADSDKQDSSSSSNNNTTTVSSNNNKTTTASNEVVKAAAPADNTAKVMPQTGLTAETPVVFGVMMVAALAGAGAYLFAIRKKLN